jgi:hypothetical protein
MLNMTSILKHGIVCCEAECLLSLVIICHLIFLCKLVLYGSKCSKLQEKFHLTLLQGTNTCLFLTLLVILPECFLQLCREQAHILKFLLILVPALWTRV